MAQMPALPPTNRPPIRVVKKFAIAPATPVKTSAALRSAGGSPASSQPLPLGTTLYWIRRPMRFIVFKAQPI